MPKFADIALPAASTFFSDLGSRLEEQRKRKQKLEDDIKLLFAAEQAKRTTNPSQDITKVIEAMKATGFVPQRASLSATGDPTWQFGPPKPVPGAAKSNAIVNQALASKAQLAEIFNRAETELPAIQDVQQGLRAYVPEGVEALFGGMTRKAAASTGFNEPARAFLETQVANARQVIRGLGEVGVLTDKDVADSVKLLPSSTDSVTVRKSKLRSLNSLIDAKLRIYQTKSTVQSSDQEDNLQSLSDEELQAIIEGRQ